MSQQTLSPTTLPMVPWPPDSRPTTSQEKQDYSGGERGEGDGKEKTGYLPTWQEWSNGVFGVTNCPCLRGAAGVPGTSCWSQE